MNCSTWNNFRPLLVHNSTTVTGWLAAGISAGWTDNGNYTTGLAPAAIVSAVAASAQQQGYNALGVDIVGSPGTLTAGLFDGEPLNTGDLVVRFGWWGDANVDGQVDFADLSDILPNYGHAGHWFQGDFNYDGAVAVNDFNLLAENFEDTTPLPAASENQQYSLTLPGDLLENSFGLLSITNWQVRWGDGTSTNYPVANGASPDITASHTYATPNVGDYQLAILAYGQDDNGNDVSYILPHQDVVVTPAAPTNISATESTAGEVDLDWQDASWTATSYLISATPAAGGATISQTVGGGSSNASFTGLTADVNYTFTVRAVNTLADGLSSQSTAASFAAAAPAESLTATGPTAVNESDVGDILALASSSGSNITSWNDVWTDRENRDSRRLIDECRNRDITDYRKC